MSTENFRERQFGQIKYRLVTGQKPQTQVQVDPDGNIIVFASPEHTDEDIEQMLQKNAVKIHKALTTWGDLNRNRVKRTCSEGESFPYLGKTYRLKLVTQQGVDLELNGDYFVLNQTLEPHFRVLFQDWYTENGTPVLQERVQLFALRLGQNPKEVVVAELGDKWGACTPSGIIKFNWKLLMAPLSVIDYIVVHELCHLSHPNHTDQFWKSVEMSIPTYRNHVRWLEEHGSGLEI